MKTASLGSGARPEAADGLITLTVTYCRTSGFPGTSRVTTSAPELGVIDVFSKHAIESQHEFARHGDGGHSAILFSFHQPKIKTTEVSISFAVDYPVCSFDE